MLLKSKHEDKKTTKKYSLIFESSKTNYINLDETTVGDLYTYLVKVNLIYSSVDESSIQSGTITAIGKAYKELC